MTTGFGVVCYRNMAVSIATGLVVCGQPQNAIGIYSEYAAVWPLTVL